MFVEAVLCDRAVLLLLLLVLFRYVYLRVMGGGGIATV